MTMTVTARLRNQSTRYSGDVSEGRQPVDPAPRSADAVDVVLDFLNSVDVECGTDEMRDGGSWDAWIAGRPCFADLPAEGADGVRRARPLRDYLRARALGEQATAPSPVAVDVTFGGVDGSAVLRGAGTTGRVAASVAELVLDGRWPRVKICPADDCRWAFYDRSRNSSRQWCSMAVCGNRAKARNHRLRAAGEVH